jgi:superfamily I DNA/RNA helicase
MDHKAFIAGKKTLVIAPAGHGKTHTIVECLKLTSGRHLVLTHTHAGIASIKEKILKESLESQSYHIETISSFVQKYVHAFYCGSNMPSQDAKDYHDFIINKALPILRSPLVQKVITGTYTGLFVDEYQDCTLKQHAVIMAVSQILPTHILGDPLQGIFDFNGQCVSFEDDLKNFVRFPDLPHPHRWYKEGHNKNLGDKIKHIRGLIEQNEAIPLKDDNSNSFHVFIISRDDIFKPDSKYRQYLDGILKNKKKNPDLDSLLILTPEYIENGPHGKPIRKGDITHRSKLKSLIDYSKSLQLIEAIDDKTFYSLARTADDLINKIGTAKKKINRIKKDLLESLFNTTDTTNWFNQDGLKQKRDATEATLSLQLAVKFEAFINLPSPQQLADILTYLRQHMKFGYKRDELYRSLVKALQIAASKKIPVFEAMKENRNVIRRTGRKVHGKCLGTTLLTKGLEFDTVVILDANKYDNPKHLYVAISRCCKRLIIFSETDKLAPYNSK